MKRKLKVKWQKKLLLVTNRESIVDSPTRRHGRKANKQKNAYTDYWGMTLGRV